MNIVEKSFHTGRALVESTKITERLSQRDLVLEPTMKRSSELQMKRHISFLFVSAFEEQFTKTHITMALLTGRPKDAMP